jgi:hypothetical protein
MLQYIDWAAPSASGRGGGGMVVRDEQGERAAAAVYDRRRQQCVQELSERVCRERLAELLQQRKRRASNAASGFKSVRRRRMNGTK